MGTRSIVAVPDAEHGFRGRYIHWDGYPSGVGEALRTIVNRDGYDFAVKVLTEQHYGWSSVNGAETQELGSGQTDGRFAAVPGYGVAYTTSTGGFQSVPQSSPDDWHFGDDAKDTWCEWAYVLGESEIGVFRPDGGRWVQVGWVAYTDAAGMSLVG